MSQGADIPLDRAAYYLEDVSRQLNPKEAYALFMEGKGFQSARPGANLGYSKSAFWIWLDLRFRLKAREFDRWWLLFDYSYLDLIDVHYIANGEVIESHYLGDMRPVPKEKRIPYHILPLHRIFDPAKVDGVGTASQVGLLIRVDTGSSYSLGMRLMDEAAISNFRVVNSFLKGVFYGVLAIMLLYNLFIYLSTRDGAYLWYSAGVGAMALMEAGLDGYFWLFSVFTDPHWNNQITALLMSAVVVILCQFSRTFLGTRKYIWIDRGMRFMILTGLWSGVLCFIVEYSSMIQMTMYLVVLNAVVIMSVGLYTLLQGNRAALYFCMAWLAFQIGVLSRVMLAFDVLPNNAFTLYGPQLGAVAFLLLLTFALADRIRNQQKELEATRARAVQDKEHIERINTIANDHLRRYRNLFNNAAEGIFQISPERKFTEVNPAFARIFGYASTQELIISVQDVSRHCFRYEGDYDALEKLVYSQGRAQDVDVQCLRQDGSWFWASCSAVLAYDNTGLPSHIEGMLVDTTEKREKEQAFREREAALASERAKSAFFANLSHEIRTPINAITGYCSLVLHSKLKPKQAKFVRNIESASRNLLGVVNDVLDYSKIEAGKLNLESVSFHLFTVMENIFGILARRAEEKGLELVLLIQPDLPLRWIGDPLRLEQILINLINNAIKFSNGGRVVVSVGDKERTAKNIQVQFAVQDSGVGIPPEQCERLFNPFTQADNSTTRKFGGTGLGLSIARQLVHLMKGQISVQSQLGKGSTFQFDVQLGLDLTNQDAWTKHLLPKPIRVLMIDFKNDAQEALVSYFRHYGCDVVFFEYSQVMLKSMASQIASLNPDVLVVGSRLPAAPEHIVAQLAEGMDLSKTYLVVPQFEGERRDFDELNRFVMRAFSLQKPVLPEHCLELLRELFKVNIVPQAHNGMSEQLAAVGRLKAVRVLVVEDTPFNQEVTSEFLSLAGADVTLACNGKEAVDLLRVSQRGDFDVVLMDCQMPVLDGFDATRQIRNLPQGKGLPIIAMTANAMQGDRERCLAAGMDDYIAKPITKNGLYQVILSWLPKGEALADSGIRGKAMIAEVEPENLSGDAPLTAPLLETRVNIQEVIQAEQERERDLDVRVTTNAPRAGTPASLSAAVQDQSSTVLVVDREKALELMGGSGALLDRMLKRFLNEQPAAINRIESAIAEKDYAAAQRVAHTLKGISASIAAVPLNKAVMELEVVLKQMMETDSMPVSGQVTDEKGSSERLVLLESLACEANNAMQQTLSYIENFLEESE